MIKISNVFCDYKEISEKDTYGYFSIGCIYLPSCYEMKTIYHLRLGCNCDIDGEVFRINLYKIGTTSKYIVLSDFPNIPDIAVINSDEVLEALKLEVIKFFYKLFEESEKFFSSVIRKQFNLGGDITIPGSEQGTTITSPLSNKICWSYYDDIPQTTHLPIVKEKEDKLNSKNNYVTVNSANTISSVTPKIY